MYNVSMNAAKVTDNDYIEFLIAAQMVYTCTETEKLNPQGAAHDAYTRLLSQKPIDPQALCLEAQTMLNKDNAGVMMLDDSTSEFVVYAQQAWDIETHHRGIKQCTGIEKL